MYNASCPGCFFGFGEEIITPELVLREFQVGLYDWGLTDTGGPGVWSDKLAKAIKAYQQKRGYPYVTGKPEYWTLYDVVEPRIGSLPFDVWSTIYQNVTGKVPDAGVWQVQFALRQLDFNPGPIDGIQGTKTTNAIKLWQEMHEFTPTGTLTADQVATLAEEAAEAQQLGTLLVTADAPSIVEETDVTFEDPPEVVEVIEEAEAAGVPVAVREDRAVTSPKVIVTREPRTREVVAVTKVVPAPPPKQTNPWVWVGLSAAAVVAVGGAAALIVRARRKNQEEEQLPVALPRGA